MGLVLHWLMLAISIYVFYGIGLKSILTLRAYRPLIRPFFDQGRQKIYAIGIYAAGENNTAPISQTPCLRWRVVVKEAKGKFQHQTTLLDYQSIQPFMVQLQQCSQLLRIERRSPSWLRDIEALTGLKSTPHQYQQHLFHTLDLGAITFLEQHRIKQRGQFGLRRSLTVTELHWKQGDPIYLFGDLNRADDRWWIDADLVSDLPREKLMQTPIILTAIGGIFFLYTLITLF